jgi:hypothetical protein
MATFSKISTGSFGATPVLFGPSSDPAGGSGSTGGGSMQDSGDSGSGGGAAPSTGAATAPDVDFAEQVSAMTDAETQPAFFDFRFGGDQGTSLVEVLVIGLLGAVVLQYLNVIDL